MIAIVEGSGTNIASIRFALQRIGKEAVLTRDPSVITKASHVILPGVSTANSTMDKLSSLHLIETIKNLTQPVLGICLGMQLLYEFSSEGNTACLSIMKGKVESLPREMRLPQMGWNQINIVNHESPLLKNIPNETNFYFIHTYCAPISEYTLAKTNYGIPFSAIVQHQNFMGVQFHPERSGKMGAQVLENFLTI